MLKPLIISVLMCTSFVIAFYSKNNLVNGDNGQSCGTSLSLTNFTVYNKLGNGMTCSAYIAKKNGGSDDGQLYAMKVLNIPHIMLFTGTENTLIHERKTLELVRSDFPYATGLHYAFREGNWLFFVMDLGIGGCVETTLKNLDAITIKRILAEIVIAIEKLHKVNVSHNDLSFANIVIDNDGHLLLTDFGLSKMLSDDESSRFDWNRLAAMCYYIFPYPIRGEHQFDIAKMLENMTDAQLPDLKNHPYFNGIDWKMVAERKSIAPFEIIEFQIDAEQPIDLVNFFHIQINRQLEDSLIDRFYNYTFVAPEHQN